MTDHPDPLDVRPAADRVPANQVLTRKWPVLHFRHVPQVDPATWRFRIWGAVAREVELTWEAFAAEPRAATLCDIHCVTRWSRHDNRFDGVAVAPLLERAGPLPEARAVMIHAAEGYTTNLLLDDLLRPGNLLATHHDGAPLTPEHGGPIRLVVPHLYFWKSAKWVTGFEVLDADWPGFWEENGYHMRGEPWAEERFGRPDPVRMRRGPRR